MVVPGRTPGSAPGWDGAWPPRRGRYRRRAGAAAAAGLLLAGLASACAATAPPGAAGPPSGGPVGPPATAGPDVAGGTLRVGLGAPPALLDPRLVVDDVGELIARALFEGLVDVGPTGGVVPAGAASWRVTDAGRTYRFALRRATFHDGRPVTAQDHAEAILAALDPTRPPFGRESTLAGLLGATGTADDGGVRSGTPADVVAAGGVEVVGTWDLVLRLTDPDPRFLAGLSDIAFAPLPPQATTDPAAFAAAPIGNGPFRLLGPRQAEPFLRLVAVPGHHRTPQVDELLLQFYPEDVTAEQRWSDLVAGRLQVARIPPGRRAEAVERFGRAGSSGGPTTGLHEGTLAAVYAYAFATDVESVADVRVRRALAAAVDRTALAAAVGGGALPASGLLPPTLLPGLRPPACGHCVHDPVLARELLAAVRADAATAGAGPASDGDRLPIALLVPRRVDHVAIAELVAAQWERTLDVRVTLRAVEPTTLPEALREGSAPVFRPPLRAGLGGAAAVSSLLDPFLRSDAPRSGGGTAWGDAATDALLDRLRVDGDPAAAAALDAAVTEAVVLLPLLWFRHDLVVVPGLRGFQLDPTGRWWPERVALG
jgi:oligopeptide transport system substrate-binding protein